MQDIFIRFLFRLGRWLQIEIDYKSTGEGIDESVETELD